MVARRELGPYDRERPDLPSPAIEGERCLSSADWRATGWLGTAATVGRTLERHRHPERVPTLSVANRIGVPQGDVGAVDDRTPSVTHVGVGRPADEGALAIQAIATSPSQALSKPTKRATAKSSVRAVRSTTVCRDRRKMPVPIARPCRPGLCPGRPPTPQLNAKSRKVVMSAAQPPTDFPAKRHDIS
jgi:hypothetical protein